MNAGALLDHQTANAALELGWDGTPYDWNKYIADLVNFPWATLDLAHNWEKWIEAWDNWLNGNPPHSGDPSNTAYCGIAQLPYSITLSLVRAVADRINEIAGTTVVFYTAGMSAVEVCDAVVSAAT